MDTFASPVELAERMQRDLASLSMSAAVSELAAATARVREEARQTISRATSTVYLDTTGSRRLLLPQIPVVSIASVTLDGTVLVADVDYFVTPDSGILWRLGGGRWLSSAAPYLVEVTYTHGHDPVPQAVRDIVLDSAARAMLNPRRVASETIGGSTSRYQHGQHEIGGALLPSEIRTLANYAAR